MRNRKFNRLRVIQEHAAVYSKVMEIMKLTTPRFCLIALLAVTLLSGRPLQAATHSFTNSTTVLIPFSSGDGVSEPYPSVIVVSNLAGSVVAVTITLHGLSHESPRDLDMLLVSPNASTVVFYSGAGSAGEGIVGVDLTLDDAALSSLPSQSGLLVSGTYKPTQYFGQDDYSFNESGSYTNIPDVTYGTNLMAVAGGSPNGAWLLFIDDNGEGFPGILSNGWSIAITLTDSNIPPVFAALGPQSVSSGSNLVFEVTASDAVDNDFITLSASNLPVGATFDATNDNGYAAGSLVWNSAAPEGVYTSFFYAADVDGISTQEVVITVNPPPPLVLDILALDVLGGNLVIRWESDFSFTYTVLVSTNLTGLDGGFSELITVQGSFIETAVTTTPTAASAAYRIIGQPGFGLP